MAESNKPPVIPRVVAVNPQNLPTDPNTFKFRHVVRQ